MQDNHSTLYLPKGAFTNHEESLELPVSFSSITFKTFVVLCSLARRIGEAAPSISGAMASMDMSSLARNLKSAKV